MTYRIRYRYPSDSVEAEVIVEANSPNEAMVKFRCLGDGRSVLSKQHDMITSVTPVNVRDVHNWYD